MMSKVCLWPAPAERPSLIILPPVCELLSLIVSPPSNTAHIRPVRWHPPSSLSGNVGVLLLCEVAVKPWLELTDAHYNADEYVKKAKKLYDHSLLSITITSTHRPCVEPPRG